MIEEMKNGAYLPVKEELAGFTAGKKKKESQK